MFPLVFFSTVYLWCGALILTCSVSPKSCAAIFKLAKVKTASSFFLPYFRLLLLFFWWIASTWQRRQFITDKPNAPPPCSCLIQNRSTLASKLTPLHHFHYATKMVSIEGLGVFDTSFHTQFLEHFDFANSTLHFKCICHLSAASQMA